MPSVLWRATFRRERWRYLSFSFRRKGQNGRYLGGIRRGSRSGRGETGGFDIDIRRDLKRLNRVLTCYYRRAQTALGALSDFRDRQASVAELGIRFGEARYFFSRDTGIPTRTVSSGNWGTASRPHGSREIHLIFILHEAESLLGTGEIGWGAEI